MSSTHESVSLDFFKIIDVLEKNMLKFWESYERFQKNLPYGSTLSIPAGSSKHTISYNSNMIYITDMLGYTYLTLAVTNMIYLNLSNVSFDDEDLCIKKNKHLIITRGEFVYNSDTDMLESVEQPRVSIGRESFEEWHFQTSTVMGLGSFDDMIEKIEIYRRLKPQCYGFETIHCESNITTADIITSIIEVLY